MATLEATLAIHNRASRTLTEIRKEAERTDAALLRAGRSADMMGDARAMRSFSNAERGIRGVRQESDRANKSLRLMGNHWVLILGAVVAATPALTRAGGVILQLTGSLVRAAGGAGVIGGGALGMFLVGLTSIMAVAKPMTEGIKNSSKALDAYNQAVSLYGVRSTQAASAAKRLNLELKQAPAHTLALLQNVKALGREWRQATRPGQGSLMDLLLYGVARVRNVTPQLAGMVNANVAAISRGGADFLDRILNPTTLRDVRTISRDFRSMVPDMAAIAGDLTTIAVRFIRDAGPFVRSMTRDLREWVDRWDRSSQDTAYMHERFTRWTNEFRTWLSLLRGTENLLSALLGSATGGGREIAGITRHFDRWAAWIRSNPVRMQRFWQDSTRFARGFGNLLVYIGRLLFGLSDALAPGAAAIAQMLASIGPEFLNTLRQVGLLAESIFGGVGGMGGPLAIFLQLLNEVLGGLNALLHIVPGLGPGIAAAFVLWSVVRFANWISTATGRMLGLTVATDAQAAANARAFGVAGGVAGGAGGGGGVFVGGAARRTVASRLAGARFVASPSGEVAALGLGARMLGRGGGGLRLLAPAARTVGRYALPVAGVMAALDAVNTPREGNFRQQYVQTTFGILHGGSFGLIPRMRTPSEQLISDLQGGTALGGLTGAIARRGGDSPTTLRQIMGQISAYTMALVAARGLSSQAANTFRAEVNSNLAALRVAARQMRSQRGHADFMRAADLLPQLGGAYNIVNRRQGPVAAMDFVIEQSIARFRTLGPRGKKHLADSVLLWASEMKQQNPKLTAEWDKLRDSIIGRYDKVLSKTKETNKNVLQGMTMEWPKIRDAMSKPMEQAEQLVSTSFTKIQQQAQGSLIAMGYTAAQAMNIIRQMELTGLIPGSMTGPGAGAAATAAISSPAGVSLAGTLAGTTKGAQASYFRDVLKVMKLPATAANVRFLTAWARREGVPQSVDPYNLLGTTLPMGGSHGTNAPGVQAYPTRDAGVRATASMLRQKNFTGIHSALASGNPEAYRGSPNVQAEMRSWSGGGYSWPTATSTRRTQSAMPPSRTLQGVRVHIGTIHYNAPGDVRRVVAAEIKQALLDVEEEMRNMGTAREEDAIR